MKKLLLILLVLASAIPVMAQTPQASSATPNYSTYYLYKNYLGVDMGFLLPQRDTTWTPSRPALTYRPADSTVYYYTMRRWIQLGSGSQPDTVLNDYLLKAQFIDSLNANRQYLTRIGDSAYLTLGGTINISPDSALYATKYWITSQGYITQEVDPVFTASPAYGITTTNINNWQSAFNTAVFASDTLYLTSVNGAVTKIVVFGDYVPLADSTGSDGYTSRTAIIDTASAIRQSLSDTAAAIRADFPTGGGGSGISQVIGQSGITNVNDSTVKADTSLLATLANIGNTTQFIRNQTTVQSGSNFFIDGKATIGGSASVRGDSLWIPNKVITQGATATNIYRVFTNTSIANSAETTMPPTGIDWHGMQGGIEMDNTFNIDANASNNISGIRGALALNGFGTSIKVHSEGSPISGLSASMSAFNNSNYTDVAGLTVSAPYTFNIAPYTTFSGHIDSTYQIYLQAVGSSGIDANIGDKYGIYQNSTYHNRLNGGIEMPIKVQSITAYTLTQSDYVVINTSATTTYTLPPAADNIGQIFKLVNQSGTMTISPGFNNLAGSNTTSVAAGAGVTIQSDGTNYYQIP